MIITFDGLQGAGKSTYSSLVSNELGANLHSFKFSVMYDQEVDYVLDWIKHIKSNQHNWNTCLLYTSPSPRDS